MLCLTVPNISFFLVSDIKHRRRDVSVSFIMINRRDERRQYTGIRLKKEIGRLGLYEFASNTSFLVKFVMSNNEDYVNANFVGIWF